MINSATLSCSRCNLARGYVLGLLVTGALYVVSVAPGPLWQDSGMAQNRTLARDLNGELGLALSHPLYYVLAISFQALPFNESAFKTNLVSAVFGAFTVANVLILLRLVTGCWRGAIVGACSLAVAHTFWQHSALAEVYTVTTALLTLELLCLWKYLTTKNPLWLCAVFGANGLGISNHMFASLSAVCYGVATLYWVARRRLPVGWVPMLAAAWLAGAGLYGVLIVEHLRAGESVTATIKSALVGNYASKVFNIVPSKRLIANSIMYLGLNFPTPAALLVLIGLRGPGGNEARKTLRWILGVVSAIHLIWAARYNVADQYTFFIPLIVLISVWLGLGADSVLQKRPRWFGILIAAALLPPVVYLALPAMAARAKLNLGLSRKVPFRDEYRYFLWPWKVGYDGARQFAEAVIRELPPGSVLVADSTTVEPVWYIESTRHLEMRVRVYPMRTGPLESRQVSREAIAADVAAGRVYLVSPVAPYSPEWLIDRQSVRLVKTGVFYRVVPLSGATRPVPDR